MQSFSSKSKTGWQLLTRPAVAAMVRFAIMARVAILWPPNSGSDAPMRVYRYPLIHSQLTQTPHTIWLSPSARCALNAPQHFVWRCCAVKPANQFCTSRSQPILGLVQRLLCVNCISDVVIYFSLHQPDAKGKHQFLTVYIRIPFLATRHW